MTVEKLPSDGVVKDVDERSQHGKVDVFVDNEEHQIHYKTLSWQVRIHMPLNGQSNTDMRLIQFVAMLMIAEIVSNGMLSLPSTLAIVGR